MIALLVLMIAVTLPADAELTAPMHEEWERVYQAYPRWVPPPPELVEPVVEISDDPVERWRPLVADYFRPADVNLALRIIDCESHGDPNAKNPRSSASGLWQHLATYWPSRASAAGWGGSSIWDPEANTAVAAWLAYSEGFHHWNASRGCWGG